MTPELEVDLEILAADLDASHREFGVGESAAERTSREVDSLERRVAALRGNLGGEGGAAAQDAVESAIWDDLTSSTPEDGSPSATPLIDPEEEAAIERRFVEGFRLRTSLDRYDLLAAVSAGIAASAVDWLIVRLPNRTAWEGELQSGSSLTRWFRSWAQDSDNALSEIAKVGFDQVVGLDVEGMGPMSHRIQTFGHDPLIGLALGTMDIMRGTVTAASSGGEVVVRAAARAPVENPAVALGLEVLHLLSDVGTKAGLPLPGMGLLMAIPSIGEAEVARMTRLMYLRGYDTWHFLTMATTVATVELVCRGYFGIRPSIDPEYEERIEHEATAAGVRRVSDHPRYQAISLIGHGVAAGGNAARVLAAGGNPLAFNYTQWATFASKVLKAARASTARDDPSQLNLANRVALHTGWAQLELDVDALGR